MCWLAVTGSFYDRYEQDNCCRTSTIKTEDYNNSLHRNLHEAFPGFDFCAFCESIVEWREFTTECIVHSKVKKIEEDKKIIRHSTCSKLWVNYIEMTEEHSSLSLSSYLEDLLSWLETSQDKITSTSDKHRETWKLGHRGCLLGRREIFLELEGLLLHHPQVIIPKACEHTLKTATKQSILQLNRWPDSLYKRLLCE